MIVLNTDMRAWLLALLAIGCGSAHEEIDASASDGSSDDASSTDVDASPPVCHASSDCTPDTFCLLPCKTTSDYAQTSTTSVMNGPSLTVEAWVKPELRGDGTDFPANVISDNYYYAGQYGRGFGVNVWAAGSQLKIEYPGGSRAVSSPDVA